MPLLDCFLVLILAAVVWIVALIFTTVFHELGHALTDYHFGGEPVLHHNWVATGRHDRWATVVVAAAGPVASLVQGLVFWAIYTVLPVSPSPGPIRLLVLTLACLGFSTAFGYLLITPFPNAGDMNKIAGLLNLHVGVQIAMAVLGAVLLTALARYGAVEYHRMTPFSWSYRTGLLVFVAVPWLAGAVVLIVVNGLEQEIILRIFPFFAGFFVAVGIADGPPDTPVMQVPMVCSRQMLVISVVMLVIALAGYIRLKAGVTFGGQVSGG